MKFNKQINDFKSYLLRRNHSERTIETYLKELKRFFLFLSENHKSVREIHQITSKIISDYSSYLLTYKDNKGKSLSNKTQKLKLVVLKVFFKYLTRNDYIIKDPTLALELPREEQSLPKNILSQTEVTKILNAPDHFLASKHE